MHPVRRLAVPLLACAALAAAGCDGGNLFPAPSAKPQPTPAAGTTPAASATDGPTYVTEGPQLEPSLLAAIHDLSAWDGLGPGDRRKVAQHLELRVAGFKFARMESFASGGAQHEIAIFDHERSGLEFVLVPGGSFRMGSPETESDRKGDETAHTVTLSQGLFASRTEVTQASWQKVIGKNPSTTVGDTLPVETVTYGQAAKYARRVRCTVPTEAQWEYLCRGSVTAKFSFGSSPNAAGEYAWYEANAEGRPRPVALKKPNAFGLYDVHGNVFEWTSDDKADYPTSSVTDPEVNKDMTHKAVRGGCFMTPVRTLRSAFRFDAHRSDKQKIIGFRIVKSIDVK